MKHLVSTTKTQGERKNDFNHTEPGEILTFGTECDGEAIDGGCGCHRSLSGVNTLKATTTFEVVDGDVDMAAEIIKYYHNWEDIMPHLDIVDYAIEDLRILSAVADALPVGAIVERRGSKFVVRK